MTTLPALSQEAHEHSVNTLEMRSPRHHHPWRTAPLGLPGSEIEYPPALRANGAQGTGREIVGGRLWEMRLVCLYREHNPPDENASLIALRARYKWFAFYGSWP